jgi:hypothetical protein
MLMDNFHLNDHDSLIGDKMDKKLINLCRAHDEICDIAKQVNRLFSFQMLITMAYGFLAITAQFYFLYCGLLDQVRSKKLSELFSRVWLWLICLIN